MKAFWRAKQRVTVSRQDLYDQVWAEPMVKVAERYWLSDVALKKRCRTLDIPTPPRGYWAKVAQGQKPRISPLPTRDVGARFTEFHEVPIPPKRLEIPNATTNSDWKKPLHPVVHKALLALRDRDSNDFRPNIHVVPYRLDRVGKVLSVLLYGAERQGYRAAVVDGNYGRKLVLIVNEERIDFYLNEELRYQPNPNYKPGGKEPKNIPSQCLMFNLHNGGKEYEGQTYWVDKKNTSLEDQLNEIIGELSHLSKFVRSQRLAEEKRQLERAEQERRSKAAQDQFETLVKDIDGFRFAENVRSYVMQLKQFYAGRDTDHRVSEWINWAQLIADQRDPLVARKNDPLARYYQLHEQLWPRPQD